MVTMSGVMTGALDEVSRASAVLFMSTFEVLILHFG
jgi:hypothetical protein